MTLIDKNLMNRSEGYIYGKWIFKKRPSDPVLAYWDTLCEDVRAMIIPFLRIEPSELSLPLTILHGIPIIAIQMKEAKRLGIRRMEVTHDKEDQSNSKGVRVHR